MADSYRTEYFVLCLIISHRAEELISRAAALIAGMRPVERPRITATTVRMELGDRGVTPMVIAQRSSQIDDGESPVPDLISFLQRETELSRATLANILIRSGRLADAQTNPEAFLDQALRAIRAALHELMIAGIEYERIDGAEWEMTLFESAEVAGYANRMVDVTRSIYDAIEVESAPERAFAAGLDDRIDIKLFIKLPRWFRVDTPIGTYNPDWAIVKEQDTVKVYLVRETKSTRDEYRLRQGEWAKIRCGAAHFGALGVDFDVATAPTDI